MNHIEAMLCFSAFLFILGAFAGIAGGQIEKAKAANEALSAKINAESCAAIVDSFYANAGGTIELPRLECYSKGEDVIASKKGEHEKQATTLGKKAKMESGRIAVEVNPHYR